MADIFIDDVSLSSIVVTEDEKTVVIAVVDEEVAVISAGSTGPPGMRGERGEKGEAGSEATISTDPNNMTTVGGDGGIFTPDLVADPVAYYILAKS